jgi:hypothetical protein
MWHQRARSSSSSSSSSSRQNYIHGEGVFLSALHPKQQESGARRLSYLAIIIYGATCAFPCKVPSATLLRYVFGEMRASRAECVVCAASSSSFALSLISNAALLNAPTVIHPPTPGTKLEQMDLRGAHDVSFRTFRGCGGEYKTGFNALGVQEFCSGVIRKPHNKKFKL